MRRTMLALVLSTLVAAGPATAGGGAKGDWELGLYGGYGWLDDYGKFHPKNGPIYGGRVGYFFTPQWSAEFAAQRLTTETEFDVLGVENVDVHLDALRLNALYNFGEPGQKFRPFLTAGADYEKFHPEGWGESCDYGWNAGAGFRWFLSPRWNIRADGRYVGIKIKDLDESEGNVEATLGLGLTFGGGGHAETYEAAEPPPPPANRAPTVTCAAERSEILPGETVRVTATATDPEGDPLTYAWSTTAGRVSGNAASATLDFTGATAPTSATVTVRVTDSHGNTASSDCGVRLIEPVKPAEAVSCLAGGFPRNLARITNVDKACLDDVAQRLKGDPRASVVVIGHADSRERSAQKIGEQRANAVKDYLATERGIEASRITVRSAGATKPLETGADAAAQSANRRVEVWFVPEGAKTPD
jgi:outer membrane protein OmpA-like peptidoglycan-associated protein/outer membrane protein W